MNKYAGDNNKVCLKAPFDLVKPIMMFFCNKFQLSLKHCRYYLNLSLFSGWVFIIAYKFGKVARRIVCKNL